MIVLLLLVAAIILGLVAGWLRRADLLGFAVALLAAAELAERWPGGG